MISNLCCKNKRNTKLVEQYSKEIAKLRHQNEVLFSQNKDLKIQIEKLRKSSFEVKQVSEVNSEHFLNENLNTTENDKLLKEMTDEINRNQIQYDQLVNNINDSCREYIKVFKAVSECDSLSQFVVDYLGNIDFDNLKIETKIKMANIAGVDFTLAREICNYLERYKKTHKEFVTREEKVMIEVVNNYYRSHYLKKCSYDVLDLLEVGSIEKLEFKRKSMKDIDEIGKTDFVYVVGIYVPALRTEENNGLERKAIVKGD